MTIYYSNLLSKVSFRLWGMTVARKRWKHFACVDFGAYAIVRRGRYLSTMQQARTSCASVIFFGQPYYENTMCPESQPTWLLHCSSSVCLGRKIKVETKLSWPSLRTTQTGRPNTLNAACARPSPSPVLAVKAFKAFSFFVSDWHVNHESVNTASLIYTSVKIYSRWRIQRTPIKPFVSLWRQHAPNQIILSLRPVSHLHINER